MAAGALIRQLLFAFGAALGTTVLAATGADAAAFDRGALVRLVRQDCGACHGMRLTGGLGSPLTPAALAERPLDSLVATILHGRPGTPMPAWKTQLSVAQAQWIAEQLRAGFPEEP